MLSPLGTPAVLVIDMNGPVVKRWDGFNNSAGGLRACCRAAMWSPPPVRRVEFRL